MSAVFLYVVNRSILSIGLIVMVLLLRCIFRNGSKFIRCIFWGLVGVFLLFPVLFSCLHPGNGAGDALVGMKSAKVTSDAANHLESYDINPETDGSGSVMSGSIDSGVTLSDEQDENIEELFTDAGAFSEAEHPDHAEDFYTNGIDREWSTVIPAGDLDITTKDAGTVADTQNAITENSDSEMEMTATIDSWKNRLFHGIQLSEYLVSVLSVLWLAGCVLLSLYLLVSHALVKRKVRICVRKKVCICTKKDWKDVAESDVWLCDDIDSPFLFGYLQPRIFIPSDMEEWQVSYVTAHETVHMRRRDYIWKTVAFMIAALHWFNPFVWAAFRCFCADLELSCDEKATKDMDDDDRALYAKALVACSGSRRAAPVQSLAFGKNAVKERIRVVMKKKVSRKKRIICNLLTCILFSVSFLGAAAVGTKYVSCAEESSGDGAVFDEVSGSEVSESEASGSEMSGSEISGSEVPDSETTGTVGESVLEEEKITTIVWAVPESDTTMYYESWSGWASWYKKTDRLNADLLNEQLEADGYSFRLEVKYIPWGNSRSEFIETRENETYPAEDYYASLKEVLEDGTADIVSCVSIGSDAISELVRGGYLAELSDYLDSEEGFALKNVFCEELWESVSVNSSLCLLPTELAANGTDYYAFNKAYFTEENLAAFDGTAQSFLQLLENTDENLQEENLQEESLQEESLQEVNLQGENLQEEKRKVIWGADLNSLAYSAGQQYTDGVLLDLATGKVRSLAGSEAFLEEAEAILTMRENGYFGEDGISYQPGTTVSVTPAGLERGVAVWVGVDAAEISDEVRDDVILVQMPYAYSNTLGYNVAVSSRSDCQEAALELLTLLYTNEDYANLLIWGEEGTDYEVTDGTAAALTERAAGVSAKQFWMGLYDGSWSAGQATENASETTEGTQAKADLYNDTGKIESTVTDFCVDHSKFDEEMSAFSDTATQAAYAYLKGNLDLEELTERLEKAGEKKVLSQISRQKTKWEKSKRSKHIGNGI
ncbi:MAG: extracellular solute-binding protein [Lachnospiraceae bacterium]|nr:extracellular solute-binding protein [Lachnospiraceae bacterium]